MQNSLADFRSRTVRTFGHDLFGCASYCLLAQSSATGFPLSLRSDATNAPFATR